MLPVLMRVLQQASAVLLVIIFGTVFGILTGPGVGAAEIPPIQTDRPSFSASASLVPRSSFQVELGYKHTVGDTEKKHELGQILLRYGLASNLELRLAPNSYTTVEAPGDDKQGAEDAKVSLKINLIRTSDGVKPMLTLLPGLTLDSGHSDIGNNATLPSVALLLDWSLPWGLIMMSNVGWEHAHSGEVVFDKYSASVVLSTSLNTHLSGYAEVYGFDRESPNGNTASYFDVGLIYLLGHTLSIDATLGTGLDSTNTDYFFGIGINKRW